MSYDVPVLYDLQNYVKDHVLTLGLDNVLHTNTSVALVGEIDYLIIDKFYPNLDMTRTFIKEIIYKNQREDTILNHKLSPETVSFRCEESNSITKLPYSLFTLKYLKYIMCNNNKLKYLNQLQETVIYLDASNNYLEDIYPLPSKIEYVNLHNNSLTKLPILNYNLKENYKYYASYLSNKLYIPTDYMLTDYSDKNVKMPDSISHLDLSNNFIEKIDVVLPKKLKYLDISFNKINYINQLPNTLEVLVCNDNKLTDFKIPDNVYILYLNNNPLTLLPKLPNDINLYYKGRVNDIIPNERTTFLEDSDFDIYIKKYKYRIHDQESYNDYIKTYK